MIYFNKLYFLNCDEDKSSVRDRYSTIRNLGIFNNFDSEYHAVHSKKDFVEFIGLVLRDVKENSVFPYIHFESHGSKQGVVLNSEARIGWLELSNYFKDINVACKCNLILFMASCFGAYFFMVLLDHLSMMEGNRRAPFRASIGPTNEISYHDLEQKVDLFYEDLISKNRSDIGDILQRVNRNRPSMEVQLHGMTCDALFQEAINRFVEVDAKRKFSSNANLNKIIIKIIHDQFLKNGKMDFFADYTFLRGWFLDHDEYVKFFNDIATSFFMIDLYPENQAHFKKIKAIPNWDRVTDHLR